MKKKATVRSLVLEAVKKFGPIKTADVVRAIDRDAAQVYTMISKLVRDGELVRGADKTLTVTSTPTPTATLPKALPAPVTQPTAVPTEEPEPPLLNQLLEFKNKYYDALAVIRYLESKLEEDR
jgi:hypothetical protein